MHINLFWIHQTMDSNCSRRKNMNYFLKETKMKENFLWLLINNLAATNDVNFICLFVIIIFFVHCSDWEQLACRMADRRCQFRYLNNVVLFIFRYMETSVHRWEFLHCSIKNTLAVLFFSYLVGKTQAVLFKYVTRRTCAVATGLLKMIWYW